MAKRTLVLVLVLALWLVPAVRAAEESAPVSLTAASALLMEPQSGQVIWEKNADERRPVASVTKIMAILLACEAVEQGRCSLDDVVNVSKQASGMGGSGSANKIATARPMANLYLCGDGESGIETGAGLMSPRVGVCAAHQAVMVMRLLLGECEP